MPDQTWSGLLGPFRARWRAIAAICLGCALVGLLLSVVLPRRYTAVATVLPPSEEQTGLSLAGLLRGITMPGVRVPQAVTASDMLLSVLDSNRLRGAIAARLDLRAVYGIRDSLDALQKLKKKSRFQVTQLGVIEIRVDAPRARDAAAIANMYVEELDRFVRTQRMTRGHRTRIFIEHRLADVRESLDSLQHELASYQQRHHAAAISPTSASGVESGARLFADRMNLQFQLEVARSYAAESSQEVKLLEARLEALDRQLDALPPVGMGIARLMRDLKAHEQAFAFLTAQYEDARIEEARDVVALDVLDPARAPRKPSFPRKRYFVGGALAVGLLAGLAWVAAGAPGSRA